jgi:hypothetical protein
MSEVPAVEAAAWLDDSGLMPDSAHRSGLPLRNLLRSTGRAEAGATYGRWFIVVEWPFVGRNWAGSSGPWSSPQVKQSPSNNDSWAPTESAGLSGGL